MPPTRPPALTHTLAALLTLFTTTCLNAQNAKPKIDEVYAQFCASCHGDKMQGGQGNTLVGFALKYGDDSDSLFNSIKNGNLAAGMPAWSPALDDQTIRALAVFIREKRRAAELAGNPVPRAQPDGRYTSEKHNFIVETVAKDLETPWSLAWLPDGQMLVTERPGRLRLVAKNGTLSAPIEGIPTVHAQGQGGLLEVTPHPDYATNGWIYLAYSDPQKLEGETVSLTALVRGRIKEGRWLDEETIYRAPVELYRKSGVHFGCRIVFHEGYIYFGIGERGTGEHAQDLSRPNGKIHRLHDDGRIPADNPFVKTPQALPSIWSYGHRNPQGFIRHPATGDFWETEHGPRGGDELNLIRPGQNYGWPLASYGMNYNGTPLTPNTTLTGKIDPVIYWTPSIAASGLTAYTGDQFPSWKNNLFAGGLASEEVHRLVLTADGKVSQREIILKNFGRVRDVRTGPDGFLYIALNTRPKETNGRIIRLRPAE